jgi:hypothetical protein
VWIIVLKNVQGPLELEAQWHDVAWLEEPDLKAESLDARGSVPDIANKTVLNSHRA